MRAPRKQARSRSEERFEKSFIFLDRNFDLFIFYLIFFRVDSDGTLIGADYSFAEQHHNH